MKILVIEDDPDMASTLQDILSSQYTVEVATNGQQGSAKARRGTYDLILLDLALGDTDGMSVCKEVRAHNITTPILVVTGRQSVTDKVTALDAGADDYISKPFNRSELVARVRALLRRPVGTVPIPVVQVGNLTLNQAQRTVMYKNKPVELRRKEFDLLEYLVRSQGQVVTRSMILDHVWGSEDTTVSNTIDVHIKYLRDKIDRRFKVSLIQTIPGIGYKMTL